MQNEIKLPKEIKESMKVIMMYAATLRGNYEGKKEEYLTLENEIEKFTNELLENYIGCSCKKCNSSITKNELYDNKGLCYGCLKESPAYRRWKIDDKVK